MYPMLSKSLKSLFSVGAFIALNSHCFGQCTLNVNLGPDTTICGSGPLILDAGTGFDSYSWSTFPPQTQQTLNVSSSGTFSVITSAVGPNQVINGDFSSGGTGFTTNYTLGAGGTWGLLSTAGSYAITTSPSLAHNNFPVCGDHTTGSGNMLVVNGATTLNQNIWCQTIVVTPQTDYKFSTWVQNYFSNNPALLSFTINGVALGNNFSPSSSGCPWQNFSTTWNSGNSTSAQICITNQNTAGGGNDFALDDISFNPICAYTDTIDVVISPIPLVSLTLPLTVCASEPPIPLISGSPSGGTYSGAGILNDTLNPAIAGVGIHIISYSYINSFGCGDTVQKVITVLQKPQLSFDPIGDICLNDENISLNQATPSGGDYTINGNLATEIDPEDIGEGSHILSYSFTNSNGCTDSIVQNIHIYEPPIVQLNTIDPLCLEDSPLPLNMGTPMGGYYTINGINRSSINPSLEGEGMHEVVYSFADTNSCADSTSVLVLIEACESVLSIPNIFTPNGDRVNDLFTIKGENIAQYSLKVYNRWGQTVFESNEISNIWDGTYNGNPVSDGVYMYVVRYSNKHRSYPEKKGFVTISKS